jgi:RNA ligase (TIGR02306 family)
VSWFGSEVIKIEKLEKHPNSDHLSLVRITKPVQATLVVRTSDWAEGQLAAYVMPDSIASDTPEFAFLGDKKRIKATKLRGIVSMGLLIPARPHWKEGDNVTEELGIKKYEDTLIDTKIPQELQECRGPSGEIKYTDIESIRRYPDVFKNDEPVILQEKIEGQNFRAVYQNNQLFCGSHKRWLHEGANDWWRVAFQHKLPEILPRHENKIFFGEVFGNVNGMSYGLTKGNRRLLFFDIFDISRGFYLDYDELKDTIESEDLELAPALYRGPWLGYDKMLQYGEGPSKVDVSEKPALMEGWVAKGIKEEYDETIGRKILKYRSEEYLANKGHKK